VLSVVVPTRNEAGNVEPLVAAIAAAVGNLETEVIFIDDSIDATPEVLERLAASPPTGLVVRVVRRPPERQNGLGPAALEGLKLAEGVAVAVMDGDLQHPPGLLPEMLAALREHDLDLVVASRYKSGGSAAGLSGPARRLVSAVSRRFVQLLFREARKTSDPLSGYFICRRGALDGLEFRPIGFKILLEILVCTPNAEVGEVALRFGRRQAGISNASMAQGWLFMRHVFSLLTQVRGSARFWKYAAVGGVGLAVFLGLLFGGHAVGLGAFQAWALAFVVSLFLNWQLNRVVTFADVASPFTPGRSRATYRQVYLPVAVLGGCANLLVFALLIPRLSVVLAGVGGAFAAMLVNFVAQRGLIRRPPRRQVAPAGLNPIEARVSSLLGGTVRVFPPGADQDMLSRTFGYADVPSELVGAGERRKPALVAEAPSRIPQARHDIGMSAWLAIPMMEGHRFLGLLVAHRQGDPYTADELDLVLRSLRIESREAVPETASLPVPGGKPTEAG
jgi:dolichol-phosphate mannosyltransferase